MTTLRILTLITGFTLCLSFSSCNQEMDEPAPAEINRLAFATAQLTVARTIGTLSLVVTLDKPALQPGTLTVAAEADPAIDIRTQPAIQNGRLTLRIEPGQRQVSFVLMLSPHGPEQQMTFRLTQVSPGFTTGEVAAMTVRLLPQAADEPTPVPVAANFATTQESVRENAPSGWVVQMFFSESAPGAGWIEVDLASEQMAYGQGYTTSPAAEHGRVRIPVEAGDHRATLTVQPVDDRLHNGYRTLSLRLVDAGGAISVGTQSQYLLRVIDDELSGMPHSYAITEGGSTQEVVFSYGLNGQLVSRTWTEGQYALTRSFGYSAGGLILTARQGSDLEVRYIRDSFGRIYEAHEYIDDRLTLVYEYEYDAENRITKETLSQMVAPGARQGQRITRFRYENGNLTHRDIYVPVIMGSTDYVLLREERYEYWPGKLNAFPEVQIIPEQNVQLWLVAARTERSHGVTQRTTYDYTFDSFGRAIEQRGSNGRQAIFRYFE